MGLRFLWGMAILFGAVSGCAAVHPSQRENGVAGRFQPPNFDQILIARDSVALADVVAILVSKGYAVTWDSPKEIAAQYQVLPGQILVMTCAYLGQSTTPAATTTAAVACTAVDLASGAKLYAGRGESRVRAGQTYVTEAIGRALEKFPAKEGTGHVLSAVRLPPRETGPAPHRPPSLPPDRDATRPPG